MQKLDQDFWTGKYQNQDMGWDIGYVSTPIKEYIDQLENKDLKILIPGGGNSYEAEYLFKQGFKNVFVVDISAVPFENLLQREPNFPKGNLIQKDFFKLNGKYDLILEQTFFCALDPSLRKQYVEKMHDLLADDGKLVGLLFDAPLNETKPPFGGNKALYKEYFKNHFSFKKLETAYNSIPPRQEKELFIHFLPK